MGKEKITATYYQVYVDFFSKNLPIFSSADLEKSRLIAQVYAKDYDVRLLRVNETTVKTFDELDFNA